MNSNYAISVIKMSLKENKALVSRYFEMTAQNMETIADEVLDVDFINHDFPVSIPGLPQGREGLKQSMKNIIYRAFPDTQFAIDDLIAEGDRVVVRYTYWGTHTGAFLGIAPSGKKLTATAIAIYRIVDGKIKEQWLADRRSTPNIIAQVRSG